MPNGAKIWSNRFAKITAFAKDILWWIPVIGTAVGVIYNFLGYNIENLQGLIFRNDQAWYYLGQVKGENEFRVTGGWIFLKEGPNNNAIISKIDTSATIINFQDGVDFYVMSSRGPQNEEFFIGRLKPTQKSSMQNIALRNSCFRITEISPSTVESRYLWGKGTTLVGKEAKSVNQNCDL